MKRHMIGSAGLSLRRCLRLGVLVEDGEAGFDRLLEEVLFVFVLMMRIVPFSSLGRV